MLIIETKISADISTGIGTEESLSVIQRGFFLCRKKILKRLTNK